MIRKSIFPAVMALACAACGASAPEAPPPEPQTPMERLEAILETDLGRQQDSLFSEFVSEHARVDRMLRVLALDSTASPLARANTVLRMGRHLLFEFDVYGRTIEDEDARVRGATIATAGRLGTHAPELALPILAQGLVDPQLGVQAKALQELRDLDPDLLRWYVSADPPDELRPIAVQMLRGVEAFGAPLAPRNDGTLRRTSPAGVELVLRPDTVWPEWDAMMGTLEATTADGTRRTTVDSVEAVGGVIPAVVDATGRYVAVESARRIEVHDLEGGAVRVLGRGIAPRPLPLSSDFFYFREIEQQPMGEQTRIRYEMVRTPFGAGATGSAFDTIAVRTRPDRRGALSPLRWVRIRDRLRGFELETDGIEGHVLPTPMGGSPRDEPGGG